MIDSVNFIIYEIIKLNLQKVINLGITYRIFQYRRNDFGNYYRKYGKATDLNDKNLISQCIEFEYNNILFQYYGSFKCIVLIANAHSVLQKADILLSDRNTYIDKMESTFTEEQQKLFEQYWEITSQMSCEEEQQIFLFGYIIATKLNMESKIK